MDEIKGKLQLAIGREYEFYPISIELDAADEGECSPCVYAPQILKAEDYPLADIQIQLAWEKYQRQEKIGGFAQGDALNYSGSGYQAAVEYVNPTSYVTRISLKQDDNQKPAVLQSTPLKLIRYGVQIVRVYGPEIAKVWEANPYFKYAPEDFKTVNLYNREKMMVLNRLSSDRASLLQVDYINYGFGFSTPQPKGGFDKSVFDIQGSDKQGRLSQKSTSFVHYTLQTDFAGKWFTREYLFEGNRGDLLGKQVTKVGRFIRSVREALHFANTTSQRIKYWYYTGYIQVLDWTDFVDQHGSYLYNPNDAPHGANTKPVAKNGTFYSTVPCWGSMIIEYPVPYTKYRILYDFPEPIREFEISANKIERVGYVVYDKKGVMLEYSAHIDTLKLEKIEGQRDGYQQVIQDFFDKKIDADAVGDALLANMVIRKVTGSNTRIQYNSKKQKKSLYALNDNPIIFFMRDTENDFYVAVHQNETVSVGKSSGFDYEEIFAVKLFKKLEFKPFKTTPIEIYATNGKRTASTSFTPKSPVFCDLAEKELPKVCVYQKRVRDRVYPDINDIDTYYDVDHIEESTFVDTMGNVTQQKFEWRSEQGRTESQVIANSARNNEGNFNEQQRTDKQNKQQAEQAADKFIAKTQVES